MTAIVNDYAQKKRRAQKKFDLLSRRIHSPENMIVPKTMILSLKESVLAWLYAEYHRLTSGKVSSEEEAMRVEIKIYLVVNLSVEEIVVWIKQRHETSLSKFTNVSCHEPL